MKINPILKRLSASLLTVGGVALTLLTTGCSMVNEDMPDCPNNFVVVDFEYKYHMSSEYFSTEDDWFGDHAGSAYLYVFDEAGTFLFRKEKNKAFMSDRKNPDFSIWLDQTECEPGKKYIFAAMAQGNHVGYEASLGTPGFSLVNEMVPYVSKIDDYKMRLDRDGDGYYDFGVVTDDYGVFDFKTDYKNNKLKLDTLWSTRPGYIKTVEVPERDFRLGSDKANLNSDTIHVTMSMMRITNSIKVNLVYEGFSPETNVDDFKFLMDFPKGNGTLGFTGDFDPDLSQELMYFTLRKQVQQYQYKNNGAQYDSESDNDVVSDEMAGGSSGATRAPTYCINAEFGVSRLQVLDGSFLQIINTNTGREVAKLENLSDWLANYFDHRYDDQEFLDREYDYTIDIHLDSDGNFQWIQAGVAILGWGKRVQDVILK